MQNPHPAGPDRRLFDRWSHFYDLPWVQRLTYRPVHDAVVPVLRRATALRVLDVGCGTGLLASRIGRELPRAEVVGCDFSKGMLAQARRRPDPLGWVRADALALPFADGVFDAVVSTESFHWFPDQARALGEFHRVLSPGGRLLVGMASPALGLMSDITRLGSRWVGEPLHWPTRRRLRSSLRHAGFDLLEQKRILRLPAPISFPTFLTVAARSSEAKRGASPAPGPPSSGPPATAQGAATRAPRPPGS